MLTRTAVWVLIFDRYPGDVAFEESRESHFTGEVTPTARLGNDGAFDRLNLESTCFEQFLLQDVRGKVGVHEVFGSEPAWSRLSDALAAAGQTVSLVSLKADRTSGSIHHDCLAMESFLQRSHIPLSAVIEWNPGTISHAGSGVGNSDQSLEAFSASMVWLEAEVTSVDDPAKEAKQILDFVLDRLKTHSETDQQSPVLLVTFRKGDDFFVREPLKSGMAENRLHVPLWIRPNDGHACRVQALAGSFDLLPTIMTFLGSTDAADEASPPDVAQIADLSERIVVTQLLSSEPLSLAFLCGAPQVCQDRLLKLRGDGWKAARTEEFLLVISNSRESDAGETESDGDSSEEPSRRLYVKPEDRFNVNDVSKTYATTADELAQLLY